MKPPAGMSFDDQAPAYDGRTGFPEPAVSSIVQSIREVARLSSTSSLLEIGAGTGQLGIHLAQGVGHYLGLDASTGMLEQFRKRLPDTSSLNLQLLAANANELWPAHDGSVDLVFSSRAIHLLVADHVVSEIQRVIRPSGGYLLTGTVERSKDSVPSVMRRKMREFLREAGIAGRSGARGRNLVFEACLARGSTPIEPVVAATWNCRNSPSESLMSWNGKDGLAGAQISAETKENVLARLHAWALSHYHNLEEFHEAQEHYLIEGIAIPPRNP